MMIAMTVAKIGRSIKNLENTDQVSFICHPLLRLLSVRCCRPNLIACPAAYGFVETDHAGPKRERAVYHHLLAGP